MASRTISISISEDNEIYLEYLEMLALTYGGQTGAAMECFRFHMEQHEDPLGKKIDMLMASNKELTRQIKELKVGSLGGEQ